MTIKDVIKTFCFVLFIPNFDNISVIIVEISVNISCIPWLNDYVMARININSFCWYFSITKPTFAVTAVTHKSYCHIIKCLYLSCLGFIHVYPLICTGFYMITASIIKGLSCSLTYNYYFPPVQQWGRFWTETEGQRFNLEYLFVNSFDLDKIWMKRFGSK